MTAAAPAATRRRWPWFAAGAVVLAVLVVVAARLVVASDPGRAFLATYSGVAPQPAGTPVGFSAWTAWAHGLNAAFLFFAVRSGWRLHRGQRPSTFWTRRNDGRLRTRNAPVRISIDLWSHFVADTLWAVNGALFLVLTFATGHWQRLVPTSWAVVPEAASAGLQYAALTWPSENGWIHYNALQQLTYFAVVFLLGPIALLTGLRASPGLAARLRVLDAHFPLRTAKRIHWWTMWAFVAFTVVHVFLVLATGAIRNLNHMYAVRDDQSPAGAIVLVVSLLLVAGLALALRPGVVRWLAARTGTVLHRPPRAPRTPPTR
ncbi:cytochrome b/b6 domain-containing protein [Amnibacterium endophyticum]|uniref:Cytochrome b/b6 domain-containing protein n=1 Tax=Amnibacterium endophyticum TaxID=2109337 RepID=A0ABW4L8Z6_9MICO